jgi:lipoate---protein ligase
MPAETLRTIDFGTTSPLRSQTVWHAIAHGVSEGAPPTLSFVRPESPYVCIGFHRRLSEVDVDACQERGLPIYRRMVGGGPVYLDSGQLFFQITLPMCSVPASRPKAIRWLLGPAVEAFQACGIDAHVDERLEIVVGDRKICGYGAGQIGEAAIVVGNLIETFDHDAAIAVVSTPSAEARAELTRLMERYVAATPTDSDAFMSAAVTSYGEALDLTPSPGELTASEKIHLAELDTKFEDSGWIAGPARPAPAAWQVKVRAGIFVFSAADDDTQLTLGVNSRRIVRAEISDPELNGQATSLAESIVGLDLAEAANVLETSGPAGRRTSKLLTLAEPARL